MATILKRGQYQFQATIRRKNHPSQSKTFVTKRDAAAWARNRIRNGSEALCSHQRS